MDLKLTFFPARPALPGAGVAASGGKGLVPVAQAQSGPCEKRCFYEIPAVHYLILYLRRMQRMGLRTDSAQR